MTDDIIEVCLGCLSRNQGQLYIDGEHKINYLSNDDVRSDVRS